MARKAAALAVDSTGAIKDPDQKPKKRVSAKYRGSFEKPLVVVNVTSGILVQSRIEEYWSTMGYTSTQAQ